MPLHNNMSCHCIDRTILILLNVQIFFDFPLQLLHIATNLPDPRLLQCSVALEISVDWQLTRGMHALHKIRQLRNIWWCH